MSQASSPASTATDVLRVSWGAALVARPSTLLRLAGATPTPAARTVARVLGIRHLAQSVVLIAARSPVPASRLRVSPTGLRRAAAAADLLHAASAGVLATRHRQARAWALDCAIASGFGVATWRTARGARDDATDGGGRDPNSAPTPSTLRAVASAWNAVSAGQAICLSGTERIMEDLAIDSLQATEFVVCLERDLSLSILGDERLDDVRTVADLCELVDLLRAERAGG